jgi:uncharacterized protein YbaR (Trm112 family)
MIRIVCPSCHIPLSAAELEQATVDGHLSLVCPECAMVLFSEPVECKRAELLFEAAADA